MKFFTSDIHFLDDRLKIFSRHYVASTVEEMDKLIIKNWDKTIKKEDTVYVLGDVTTVKKGGLEKVALLNGYKILIKGNYDQQFTNEELAKYFDEVVEDMTIELDGIPFYLNHYPTNGKPDVFNITGHIHGTWKVQRNMINVGLDAWHFYPVDEEMIIFQYNGIKKHYDENVFAGELKANKNTKTKNESQQYHLNWMLDESMSYDYNYTDGGLVKQKVFKTNEYLLTTVTYDDNTCDVILESNINEKIKGTKKEIEDKFKIIL